MHHKHSHSGEPRTGIISRLRIAARHHSYSQTGERHYQQARIAAMHHSHLQTEDSRTGVITRLALEQGTTTTHPLESQEQA
jgi:hypothetical protein